MLNALLGGLSPQEFLDGYWQKKPLLVRGAVPGFTGLFDRTDIFDLAADPDVESRAVWQQDGAWQLANGPFAASALKRKRGPWTVLVSGTNLVSPEADTLLRRFSFIPYARLDDLMVSYATKGGGVGPHFDSYDVFLLQGHGRRHWRIGAQRDLRLVEGAPLRILENFRPSQEWTLEPGDMLYLPPQYAHDGVALEDCSTYSIGFRAPTAQELAEAFLSYLQEQISLKGRYADPALRVARQPAVLSEFMVDQVADMLSGIHWERKDVADFLGRHLSEPKAHVFFDPPENPLALRAFTTACRTNGFALDLRSQMLTRGRTLFLNGEAQALPAAHAAALRTLADKRLLSGEAFADEALCGFLYDWYCAGFGGPRG